MLSIRNPFRRKSPAPRMRGIMTGVLPAAILIAASLCFPAQAEKASTPSVPPLQKVAEKPASEPMDDPFGRSTPYGTVLGFIKAVEREDLNRATEYLDTQQLPKKARKLAQELAAVLDAADLEDLSRKPEGNTEDDLSPSRERIGMVKTGSGSHEIFLDRTQRGTELPIWLFSADTLKWVPRIHGALEVGWIERRISGTFLETRFLGQPLWRLFGILLALPLTFAIARLATRLILPVMHASLRHVIPRAVDYPAGRFQWPICLLFMAVFFYAISLIAFSAASRVFWGYVAASVATISLTWISLRLIESAGGLFEGGPQSRLGSGKIAMARLLDRLSKAFVVFIGALILFYIAGVNLTAVLAGVGIGGIAIALAAQKTLENLFGAMSIVSDRPIRVGDFCRAGEYTGTVEDIGLRSTRIRTLARTVVSVPNGQLTIMSLENFSQRDKFLFHHRIHLGYETSADQLRGCLSEIRTMLRMHPKTETETARVNLTAFLDSSIEIEIFAHLLETSNEAFLTAQEEILMKVMEIVRANGAKFALPLPALSAGKVRITNRSTAEGCATNDPR
ncbi:MAG: MscS Mechanosensitive ion channel [Deltaproteobacteria bacterium]|nr:MscS Mechanosensitive ion channel [Deltaproteobacteria bacterium]